MTFIFGLGHLITSLLKVDPLLQEQKSVVGKGKVTLLELALLASLDSLDSILCWPQLCINP